MAIFKNGTSYRNSLHYTLETELVRAAKKRDQDPEWIENERKLMLTIVNEHREQHGRAPVALGDIERVEQTAVGHVDYGHKFALYCTELAEDTP
jgi:hypothetical protein